MFSVFFICSYLQLSTLVQPPLAINSLYFLLSIQQEFIHEPCKAVTLSPSLYSSIFGLELNFLWILFRSHPFCRTLGLACPISFLWYFIQVPQSFSNWQIPLRSLTTFFFQRPKGPSFQNPILPYWQNPLTVLFFQLVLCHLLLSLPFILLLTLKVFRII
jgi:hypothetical protein